MAPGITEQIVTQDQQTQQENTNDSHQLDSYTMKAEDYQQINDWMFEQYRKCMQQDQQLINSMLQGLLQQINNPQLVIPVQYLQAHYTQLITQELQNINFCLQQQQAFFYNMCRLAQQDPKDLFAYLNNRPLPPLAPSAPSAPLAPLPPSQVFPYPSGQ